MVTDLKRIVNDPLIDKLENTSIDQKTLADPAFIDLLNRNQMNLIKILSDNMIKNIPRDRIVLEYEHERQMNEIMEENEDMEGTCPISGESEIEEQYSDLNEIQENPNQRERNEDKSINFLILMIDKCNKFEKLEIFEFSAI